MNEFSKHYSSKRKAVAWALVVVWAIAIFAASAKSGLDFEFGTGPLELIRRWMVDVLSAAFGHPADPSPIGHFSEYLVFGALLFNAMRMHVRPSRAAWSAIAIAAVYAVTDEFHQLFVPGRACDPVDWLVDVVAACIASSLCYLVFVKRGSSIEQSKSSGENARSNAQPKSSGENARSNAQPKSSGENARSIVQSKSIDE